MTSDCESDPLLPLALAIPAFAARGVVECLAECLKPCSRPGLGGFGCPVSPGVVVCASVHSHTTRAPHTYGCRAALTKSFRRPRGFFQRAPSSAACIASEAVPITGCTLASACSMSQIFLALRLTHQTKRAGSKCLRHPPTSNESLPCWQHSLRHWLLMGGLWRLHHD